MNTTTKPGVLPVMDNAMRSAYQNARDIAAANPYAASAFDREAAAISEARATVERLAEVLQRLKYLEPVGSPMRNDAEAALAAYRGEA